MQCFTFESIFEIPKKTNISHGQIKYLFPLALYRFLYQLGKVSPPNYSSTEKGQFVVHTSIYVLWRLIGVLGHFWIILDC